MSIKESNSRIMLSIFNYNLTTIAHKPILTLRRFLTNVKDKGEPENRPRAVYNIKCSNCQATLMGETGRNLTT